MIENGGGPLLNRRTALRLFAAAGLATVVARTPAQAAPESFLDVSLNLRDIGGYSGADGRRIVTGAVYRSAAISQVTDQHFAVLTQLRPHSVADLRSTQSRAIHGPDRLPPGAVPILAPVGDPDPAPLKNKLAQPDSDTLAEFRSYVTSASNRAAFGRVLNTLSASGRSRYLYHCNSGTYVTGWTTATLMTLLGVARAAVDSEFLLSNEAYGAIVARTEYLDAAFDQIRLTYQSFDNYVADGLGVPGPAVARLRDVLLVR
ncbi:tyrosine-protein phosphatase [Nocardia brasiliensis]|uniref:tyrosine-protein phosphatase n=1 Tax=Nocardia brasiliensis TaxID=37326 RepID=UPI003D8AB48B